MGLWSAGRCCWCPTLTVSCCCIAHAVFWSRRCRGNVRDHLCACAFPLDRLALYGLIVALILSGKTTTAGC